MTKKIILAAGASLLTIAAVGSAIGVNAAMNSEAKTAIENNDYTAFVEATDKDITEERFGQLVERNQTKEAITSAIENNDYEAFQNVANDKALEKVSSQEEFDALVEKYNQKQELVANLNSAIENNDFDSYKEAVIENLELKDDSDVDVTSEEFNEKIQEKFDKQVEAYQEDGSLISGNGRSFGGKKNKGGRK